MKKKKGEKSKLNEPSAVYAGKRIKFFNSLEEENEYTYKMMAAYRPEENLQNAVELIKAMYKNKLSLKKVISKRIKFD